MRRNSLFSVSRPRQMGTYFHKIWLVAPNLTNKKKQKAAIVSAGHPSAWSFLFFSPHFFLALSLLVPPRSIARTVPSNIPSLLRLAQ
jgi:hypothetical protein